MQPYGDLCASLRNTDVSLWKYDKKSYQKHTNLYETPLTVVRLPPITFTRMFEPRHIILSNVRSAIFLHIPVVDAILLNAAIAVRADVLLKRQLLGHDLSLDLVQTFLNCLQFCPDDAVKDGVQRITDGIHFLLDGDVVFDVRVVFLMFPH